MLLCILTLCEQGNMGEVGIIYFLESHRCNDLCRTLGLKNYTDAVKVYSLLDIP